MPALPGSDTSQLAIAATFVAEPLLPNLKFLLREAGLPMEVRFAPYHQVFQEMLSGTSLLAKNIGGVNVILVRLEDFLRDVDPPKKATILRRTTQEFSDALSQYAHRVTVPTVLAVLPPSPNTISTLLPDLQSATTGLISHARALPIMSILPSEEVDLVSTGERYDSVGDDLAHVPFTEEYYASLALAIVRKAHALRVPALKVLVLDCDETLWRGVVGEDGIEGITIPPALARLQQFACDVQAKGVLVCLVSKNSERDVLEVFERRSDMVLKLERVVSHRINWQSKPSNIASLAGELNLGLDSFAFLDDNPVECALMRAELPQVVTLQLPADNEIESFLSHLWVFDKVNVTEEDVRRTTMYRENAARQKSEEATTNIAEFIASLEVRVDIAEPAENEWARAAQLTQKTNQFNFSTLRRSESEIRGLVGCGHTILRVRVRDRFGDYGVVGVVIASYGGDAVLVDTFLLSCRVLGRGVEHTIVRRLGEIAQQRGLQHLDLQYLPTPRNEPARAFVESVAAKFRVNEPNRILYRIPTESARAIAHRPGHDPAAVMEALNSEKNSADKSSSALNVSPANKSRSERYSNLSRALRSGLDVLRAVRTCESRVRRLRTPPRRPASNIERQLLEMWEELLCIDGLGVEDDYFALGGTSLIAARLFAEIVRQFGVKLPLTAILGAPTVRALASELERQQLMPSGMVVELKPEGSRNLFLIHDGDGETLLYLNLARRMPSDVAVVGIEPHRIARVPLTDTRIEDIAARYADEIRRRQPFGPYFVGGMCAGGVIAYEVASQLVAAGERVELVAILDAAAPQAQKRRGRLNKQRVMRLRKGISSAHSKGRSAIARGLFIFKTIAVKVANALGWEIARRLRYWSVSARFRLLKALLARQGSWPRVIPELSVRQIYDSAEASYFPKPLSGAVVILIRARAGEGGDTPYREIYADEALGWSVLADNFTIIDVDGGHSSMLQEPFVGALAAVLKQYLNIGQEGRPTLEHLAETATA